MGLFIRIDMDAALVKKTDGLAQKLVESCPVKIFKDAGGGAGRYPGNRRR